MLLQYNYTYVLEFTLRHFCIRFSLKQVICLLLNLIYTILLRTLYLFHCFGYLKPTGYNVFVLDVKFLVNEPNFIKVGPTIDLATGTKKCVTFRKNPTMYKLSVEVRYPIVILERQFISYLFLSYE